MFLWIGILLFLAWLAAFFFFHIALVIVYVLLGLAILAIIAHFIQMFRLRGAGRGRA